ncbi:MAG TPA: hypothetical protein VNG51_27960 [Ktedonobacteraceae bacterium]|nr:hypothetical protein [Ktedonobacteraceae bacterium]
MQGRKKKILVVDDDPDILDFLQVILEEEGYSVLTTRNAMLHPEKVHPEYSRDPGPGGHAPLHLSGPRGSSSPIRDTSSSEQRAAA